MGTDLNIWACIALCISVGAIVVSICAACLCAKKRLTESEIYAIVKEETERRAAASKQAMDKLRESVAALNREMEGKLSTLESRADELSQDIQSLPRGDDDAIARSVAELRRGLDELRSAGDAGIKNALDGFRRELQQYADEQITARVASLPKADPNEIARIAREICDGYSKSIADRVSSFAAELNGRIGTLSSDMGRCSEMIGQLRDQLAATDTVVKSAQDETRDLQIRVEKIEKGAGSKESKETPYAKDATAETPPAASAPRTILFTDDAVKNAEFIDRIIECVQTIERVLTDSADDDIYRRLLGQYRTKLDALKQKAPRSEKAAKGALDCVKTTILKMIDTSRFGDAVTAHLSEAGFEMKSFVPGHKLTDDDLEMLDERRMTSERTDDRAKRMTVIEMTQPIIMAEYNDDGEHGNITLPGVCKVWS